MCLRPLCPPAILSFTFLLIFLTFPACSGDSSNLDSHSTVEDSTADLAGDGLEVSTLDAFDLSLFDTPDLSTDMDTSDAGDTPFDEVHDVLEVVPEIDTDTDTTSDAEAPEGWFLSFDDQTFQGQCPNTTVEFVVLDPNIVLMKHAGVQGFVDEPSYAVVEKEWPATETQVGVDNATATLSTDALTITVTWPGCRVVAQDSNGTVLWDDTEGEGYFEQAGQFQGAGFNIKGIRRTIPEEAGFYGFGEKTGALNKRGRRLEFWNTDKPSYGPAQDPLYQSIPFYIGMQQGNAYGVFVDNTHFMRFDIGHTTPDEFLVEAFGGDIRQYLIAGPAVADVVRRYTQLTGTQVMPPRWAVGYHQCRWSYTPDTRVLDVCEEFRSRQIPADGIWLDIDYMDGFRSWTWHPQDFPDPEGLVSSVAELGFKVTAIIDPGLKFDPGWDIYDAGLAGGHYLTNPGQDTPYVGEVWPGPAVFPDFTNPTTRSWWGTLIPRLTDSGVWGIWLDMNEPASFLAEDFNTVPGEVEAFGNGTPTNLFAIHNVYALMESKGTYEGYRLHLPNQRPFLLTRAGFAGIQRYSAVWTGDAASNFVALADQLPMLMGLGLSGVANVGSDVGGWEGNPTAELFARWIAVGSISPFYRTHVQQNSNDQEPWSYTEEVEDISRIHISKRYRLLPYYYSLFYQAWLHGDPILRPLLYEFQGDPDTWNLSDEVMVGPWMLVAPVVTEGASTRSIYLPAGRWMEAHSGAVYEGPTTVTLDVTLQALPTYLRAGSIIPKAPLMMYSDQAPLNPLTLDLFPTNEETSFTLFEDDATSNDFESGAYATTMYTLKKTDTGAILTGARTHSGFALPTRNIALRFRPIDQRPTEVRKDGSLLQDLGDYDAIFTADGTLKTPVNTGWIFDDNDRSVWVVLPDTGNLEVEVVADMTLDSLRPPVRVPVEIHLPAGTSTVTPIHVATSSSDWVSYPLAWGLEPGIAVGTLQVPRGQWFEYKYNRGSWETAEMWPECQQAENRYEFGRAHPLKVDAVAGWADWCQ